MLALLLFFLLLGAEMLPVILFILLVVFAVREFHQFHRLVSTMHWWAPLVVTGFILVGSVLANLIVPERCSSKQDLADFNFWVTSHSIWFGYLEFLCIKGGVLFPVIGFTLAIGMAGIVIAAWMIFGWCISIEWLRGCRGGSHQDVTPL